MMRRKSTFFLLAIAATWGYVLVLLQQSMTVVAGERFIVYQKDTRPGVAESMSIDQNLPGSKARGSQSTSSSAFEIVEGNAGDVKNKLGENHAAEIDHKRLSLSISSSASVSDYISHIRRSLSGWVYGSGTVQWSKYHNVVVPMGVAMIGADLVPLAPNTTEKDLMICIIDSGVDLSSLSLDTTKFYGDTTRGDTCGHGTHVAGTISARPAPWAKNTDRHRNIIGVAPGVSMYIVNAFDESCEWTYVSSLVNATQICKQAVDLNRTKLIVSMSLGSYEESQWEKEQFTKLSDEGVLLIAAAGNDGSNKPFYPASYDAVLSVGAARPTSSGIRRASFSQTSEGIDIAGPGVHVMSSWINGFYAFVNGTSMATPHVAGAAALVWSYGLKKGWTNNDVRQALIKTATRDEESNSYLGAGLVNACRASKLAGYDAEVNCDRSAVLDCANIREPFWCCLALNLQCI